MAQKLNHGALPAWRAAFLLLAITLVVRAPTLGQPLLHIDETFYLLVGDRWLHDGMWPYVGIWDRKPIGLFLLFASIRSLGGEGFLQYQLVACAFVAATAWLILRFSALLAPRSAAWVGAVAYICWINRFGGYGGQAPVFYNFLVVGAALILLTKLFITKSATDQPKQVFRAGAAAMLLLGVAIQIKPSVVFEGMFFGIALLWQIRQQPIKVWLGYAGCWIGIALLPTILALLTYYLVGETDAFVFANITSIFHRGSSFTPMAEYRLLRLFAISSPLILLSLLALSLRAEAGIRFALGWSGASLLAVLVFGTYYLHYGLALVPPLVITASLGFGRLKLRKSIVGGLIGLLIVTSFAHLLARVDKRGSRGDLDTILALLQKHQGNCPYFTGVSAPALYLLSHECHPTKYANSGHLFDKHEALSVGVDQKSELRRVVAGHPRLITLQADPGTEEDPAVRAYFLQLLSAEYDLISRRIFGNSTLLVYAPRN
jgi:hypothetical protein